MSLKYALRFHKAQNFVDGSVLPAVCSVLSLFKRKGGLPKQPSSVLFIRFSGLGDAILALPAIRRLKEKFPSAKIAVLCLPRNKEAFERQPFISSTVLFRRSSLLALPFFLLRNFRSYDLCIDSEEGFRLAAILSFFLSKRTIGFAYREGKLLHDASVSAPAKEHGVLRLARLLEPLGMHFKPKGLVPLHASGQYRKLIDQRFSQLGITARDRIAGIHAFAAPTSKWRAWPKERAAGLARLLRDRLGCKVILTGLSSDSVKAREVIALAGDPAGIYDFSDLPADALFYLISRYSLMVSIDSGPMHIAAAQGVPVIALFGPKPPALSGPFPPGRHIAFHRAPKGHKHRGADEAWAHGCAAEYIKQITVEEVFLAAVKMLGAKKARRGMAA